MYNVACIISGRGSTFLAFLQACQQNHLPGVVPRLLISTSSKAPGLTPATEAGFPAKDIYVSAKSCYDNPTERGQDILEECMTRDIHLIALMGCLMIVPENVHNQIPTINQHPARLPEFAGMEGFTVHRAVINFARKVGRPMVTEPTVHRVTKKLDGGPVIGVRIVPVLGDDTAESLDARVIKVEHELIQTTIYLLSQGVVGEFIRLAKLARPGEESLLDQAIREAKGG